MNRADKAQFIEEVRSSFEESSFVVLTDFRGSTVLEMDALRRSLETAGGSFRVVKNTLSKIAVQETDKFGLAEHFVGNIGVVFAGEDPISVAKAFKDEVKKNEKLMIKAGFFDGDVLGSDDVIAVASLPSREELLSKLLATLQEAPRQVLGVIQGPPRDLLYLLRNFAAKLEEAGE